MWCISWRDFMCFKISWSTYHTFLANAVFFLLIKKPSNNPRVRFLKNMLSYTYWGGSGGGREEKRKNGILFICSHKNQNPFIRFAEDFTRPHLETAFVRKMCGWAHQLDEWGLTVWSACNLNDEFSTWSVLWCTDTSLHYKSRKCIDFFLLWV